ncbi:MAG TPA: aminopeptidase [Pyrinomonadaceae bacterium]|jgi:aminopeptidase
MKDPRVKALARLLVNHSCSLKEGERVLVEAVNAPEEIVLELCRAAKAAGATPFVSLKNDRVIRELCTLYDETDARLMADAELHMLRQMDAFISIRAIENAQEYSDVCGDKLQNILRHYVEPVHYRYRNEHTKWVALRWPTPAMAERAGMSTEAFEDFFFDVCTIDYAKMDAAMTPLVSLMRQTDEVRIHGPGETDVRFSIKGIGQYKSVGRHNIPDGELFTAPVRDSVQGRIHYNVPSVYYGTDFRDVRLEFRDGRIVEASAAANERKLKEILDTDEGARRIGEFAFGFHPRIHEPMRDILFDEKIAGSIHLTPGNAYADADNGNRSAIHWDLILRQTPDAGGGEIWFDQTLVRRDGRFVPVELACLNPENL